VSAFAAIANLDGRPVDEDVVRAMSAHLGAFGPDGRDAWIGGWNRNVALIHARFVTTAEAERESQPLTLDGSSWVAGDVRIDAREELWRELETCGVAVDRAGGDAALLLQAYGAWGPACLDHLLGDFSFALWDGRHRRLACARDHMGVRPFYHHQAGPLTVCSTSLDCVLMHPAVPDALNEEALVEFLLFGENTNLETTIYESVRRLPPAHRLVASSEGTAAERYWTFPIDEPVYYRRDAEYAERLRALIDAAVRDRLRTQRVAVFMSGGIDSSTLAAVASRRFASPAEHVLAHTILVDGPEPDDEPRYVDQITRHLGIRVEYRRKGDAFYDPQWQSRDLAGPEPYYQQFSRHEESEYYRHVSGGAAVAYWGEGPDNALEFEWRPHLRHLAGRGRWLRALRDVGKHARYHPRLPGREGLRRALSRENPREAVVQDRYPPWMRPRVEAKYELRRRWLDTYARADAAHPARPLAYRWLTNHSFPNMCETFAQDRHRARLEFRHPYLDVRVLRFMLSVPAVPWCRDKLLMRKAAAPLLPPECLSRAKTPVRGLPWRTAFEGQPEPAFLNREAMNEFVDPVQVVVRDQHEVWGFSLAENVFAVDYWLAKRRMRRGVQ
jgi:asparagine synthase (glutamine-hydrolysing)